MWNEFKIFQLNIFQFPDHVQYGLLSSIRSAIEYLGIILSHAEKINMALNMAILKHIANYYF